MKTCMKTTISLDDRTFAALRRQAAADGLSISEFIASLLEDAVKRSSGPEEDRPFRLVTVGGGGPFPEIDFDRPRELNAVDDEERYD